MRLNYTPDAITDLENIRDHIAKEDPVSADRVVARILQSMAVLENFPQLGRPGRIEETREWSISGLPYVGIYFIANASDLDVIAILHTSRRYPFAQEE